MTAIELVQRLFDESTPTEQLRLYNFFHHAAPRNPEDIYQRDFSDNAPDGTLGSHAAKAGGESC